MSVVLATFVVVGFAAIIELLDLPEHAREVAALNRECLGVLGDDSLDDKTKEATLQRNALRLFVLLGILTGGSVLALGAPLGVVWMAQATGVGSFSAVLSVLQRLDFLAAATLVGLVAYLLVRRLRRS